MKGKEREIGGAGSRIEDGRGRERTAEYRIRNFECRRRGFWYY